MIEERRDITEEILRLYLPDMSMEKFPALASPLQDGEHKIFANEREILYQVLFDMKKDVNDLKKLVHDLMDESAQRPVTVSDESAYPHSIHASNPIPYAEPIEETMSLEEVEKDMIRKALERHNGRRKNAAADLKISERTLYRKIKEYNLE